MTEQQDQTGTPAVERRREPRRRVLFQGRLASGDANYTANCSIRDLTAGGARVSRFEPDSLSRKPVLIVVREGVAYWTRAVWADATNVGLAFERRADLDVNPPAEARPFRRLWLDQKLRA